MSASLHLPRMPTGAMPFPPANRLIAIRVSVEVSQYLGMNFGAGMNTVRSSGFSRSAIGGNDLSEKPPEGGTSNTSPQCECHVERSETSLVVAVVELASEIIRDGKPGPRPDGFRGCVAASLR